MKNLIPTILFFSFFILCNSCVRHYQLVNFNEGADFPKSPEKLKEIPDYQIQPDDALLISINSTDAEVSSIFTVSGMAISGQETAGASANHFVDREGYVQLPELGAFKVGGLTIKEVRDSLLVRVQPYIKNPLVHVRLMNFRFTILGEVNAPGAYSLAQEKVTILEAVGMSGDLSIYGNRSNILIIREKIGQREYGRINLRDRSVFESPYFYLCPGDVIYVEPIEGKVATVADPASKVLPWISTVILVVNLVFIVAK